MEAEAGPVKTPLPGAQARCRQGKEQRLRKGSQPGRLTGKEGEGQSRGEKRVGSEDDWRQEEELGAAGGER